MKSQFIKSSLSLSLIIMLSAIAACAPAPADMPASPTRFTDQLGRVVTLQNPPQRIISLAPSNTEILFALGLDDRIVAVTDYCDYPVEATTKPSIGSYNEPNIEEVVALSPSLILATSIHEERIIPQLEERGMTVFALTPRTTDEVLEAILLVGEVAGKREEASGLVAEIRNRIKAVTDKTANLTETEKPRVFYTVWHDPLTAPGSGTFPHDLIGKAGGINIAQDLIGDYPTMSLEAVIAADPEVMIAGVNNGTLEDLNLHFIRTEPRLRDISARQNNRVYGIDGNLTNRPGPRIVEGLEELARMIHPEIFRSN